MVPQADRPVTPVRLAQRGAAAIEAWPLAVHPAWLSQRVRVERARQEVAELRLLSDS